jgi:hypothetical protein
VPGNDAEELLPVTAFEKVIKTTITQAASPATREDMGTAYKAAIPAPRSCRIRACDSSKYRSRWWRSDQPIWAPTPSIRRASNEYLTGGSICLLWAIIGYAP